MGEGPRGVEDLEAAGVLVPHQGHLVEGPQDQALAVLGEHRVEGWSGPLFFFHVTSDLRPPAAAPPRGRA